MNDRPLMDMNDGLPPLRKVIAAHDLRANKKFGQNFILDLNVTRRIARQAGDLSHCDVVEIGPGPGGLTRGLLMQGARKVHVIEADPRFVPALKEIAAAYPGRLTITHGDALSIKPETLAEGPFKIVSNLPYNIATSLLVGWLQTGFVNQQWQPKYLSMTLMFQEEVAQRIIATPKDASYGRLSVLAGWLTHAELAFTLDRQVFVPAPKVTSAIVHLRPRAAPLAEASADQLQKLTAAAFGQRRKMLRSSLKQICSNPRLFLAKTGIAETARAEEVTIEEFCALANFLDKMASG